MRSVDAALRQFEAGGFEFRALWVSGSILPGPWGSTFMRIWVCDLRVKVCQTNARFCGQASACRLTVHTPRPATYNSQGRRLYMFFRASKARIHARLIIEGVCFRRRIFAMLLLKFSEGCIVAKLGQASWRGLSVFCRTRRFVPHHLRQSPNKLGGLQQRPNKDGQVGPASASQLWGPGAAERWNVAAWGSRPCWGVGKEPTKNHSFGNGGDVVCDREAC